VTSQGVGTKSDHDLVAILAATNLNYGVLSPPGVAQVSEIDASFDLTLPTIAGLYTVGLGMYLAQQAGTVFTSRDPLLPADMNREDWMYKTAFTLTTPLTPSIPWSRVLRIPNRRVLVREGFALRLTLSVAGPAGGALPFNAFLRSRISRIY
jgi:hypothetical protein